MVHDGATPTRPSAYPPHLQRCQHQEAPDLSMTSQTPLEPLLQSRPEGCKQTCYAGGLCHDRRVARKQLRPARDQNREITMKMALSKGLGSLKKCRNPIRHCT